MAEGEPWEQEVRRSLAEQAGGVRAGGTDLAGLVVARGRRARRRRQLTGLAGLAGAMALASGLLLHGWPGGPTSELGPATGLIGDPVAATPERTQEPARLAYDPALVAELAVDVVGEGAAGGSVLATGDGRTLPLGPVDEVVSAHRVGPDWAVVSGSPGTTRLWWVGAGREPVAVLAGMDAVVVERARVAWRRGALLSTATLSAGGELADRATTAAPDGDGQPVGFLGPAVLLARAEPAGWDTWQPDRGAYTPAWTDRVVRVYGGLPDGQALGLVPGGSGTAGGCLATLDPERGLAAGEPGCPAGGLSAGGPAALSPHGRWLIATAAADGAGPVLVDVPAALAQRPGAVIPVPGLAAPAGRPVWLDPEQVLVRTADSLVRVVPEKLLAGAPDAVEVVGLVSGTGLVVVQPV